MFALPKGTQPNVCKAESCRKTIYWVVTGTGHRMPVDVDCEHGKAPTRLEPGQGVPHWATCPATAEFRKKKEATP